MKIFNWLGLSGIKGELGDQSAMFMKTCMHAYGTFFVSADFFFLQFCSSFSWDVLVQSNPKDPTTQLKPNNKISYVSF